MNVWSLLEDIPDDTEQAFQTFVNYQPPGASQPVEQDAAECVGIRVVSFNFGMPQSMLDSSKQWNKTHIYKFRDVLQSLGNAVGSDFVFGSEAGDAGKGFQRTTLDFQNVVSEALPGAGCSTSGAYFHIWNVNKALAGASSVTDGTWSSPQGASTMYWQAFDLTYRDASKLAGKVGLLVGNMHIPVGSNGAPTMSARRKILKDALTFLTNFERFEWREPENVTVVRLLVGDCNLSKGNAEAASQLNIEPRLSRLQCDLALFRWQVGGVQIRRLALESTRKQYTKRHKKA